MIIKTEKVLNIVAGPDKMNLVTSVAYAYNKHSALCVTVTDDKGDTYPVIFTMLGHEDGSGNSFIVKGRIEYFGNAEYRKKLHPYRATDLSQTFEGCYNTSTREGRLNVTVFLADDKHN